MPPLSAEQLADRVGPTGFVGASEIASIVGENPWSGPIDVWLRKTGRAQDDGENPRAVVGQRAERLIASWYAEDTETPLPLMVAGETERHGAVPCVGCTPDFLVYPGLAEMTVHRPSHALQVKCVGARMSFEWPNDGVPPYVECQVQLEAEVLQVERVDVAAWLGGTDFRIIQVHRDREFGSMMLDAAVQFWDCVIRDEPPPVDGSEAWRLYLADRYPQPKRVELDEPDGRVDHWAHAAIAAREAEAVAISRKDTADNQLRELIGDGVGYLGADYIVTWKADKNGKRTLRIKRREFKGA